MISKNSNKNSKNNENSKNKALTEFIKHLRSRYKNKIKKIILYGSYARGDYAEDSDIDVLIVGDISQKEISYLTTDILLKYGEVISAIVEKEVEFEKLKNSIFHRNVLNEGVELNEL
jgi:predicted nucleotidyltransferase